MKHKITTHKGDTLLLIENSLNYKTFKIVSYFTAGVYLMEMDTKSLNHYKWSLPKGEYEIVGTTPTLTELQANDLVEYFELESVYKNYNPKSIDDYWKFNTALESFYSLLEANNIDTTKNYCLLKVKND